MAFIVCHARKIKTPTGLLQVARHNLREGVDYKKPPDWMYHPERAQQNSMSLEPEKSGHIIEFRREMIEGAALKRKPQKNASAAVEFNMSASPDWFRNRSGREKWQFLKDCTDFVVEKYGHILHYAMHFDEKTPHVHVLCVPIVGNRYTSSEFLGGKDGLRGLQQEIYEKVGKKWGLERGFEGSTARHDGAVGYTKKLKREFRAYMEVRDGHYPKEIAGPKFLERLTGSWAHEVMGVAAGEREKTNALMKNALDLKKELEAKETSLEARERELDIRLERAVNFEKKVGIVLAENTRLKERLARYEPVQQQQKGISR